MRADARRNYERLLQVASEAVAEHGVEASLDEIAKRAGVGAGTLYRHFPNRQCLLDAVFDDRIQILYEQAQHLADKPALPPDDALTFWLRAFVDHLRHYRGLSAHLKTIYEMDSDLLAATHQRLTWSVDTLLTRAQQDGTVRRDVDSSDVLRLVHGVGMVVEPQETGDARAERMLSVLMDGLRTRHQ